MNEYTIDGILKREFKGGENKTYWRVSCEIWKHVVEYGKAIEKAAKVEWENEADKQAKEAMDRKKAGKKSILTPEERMEAVAELLDTKLLNKELSAAEIRELKDLFNLKAADQDILIEMVDYRTVELSMAEIIDAVRLQINKANE